jgi:hypothetical protein
LQRREFLKSTAALAGAAAAAGHVPTSSAATPKDTLLVLVENGPNSLDIHGVGTTFRSYVACWNLYDRLLTFGHKTLPDGSLSYDHTKIEAELAEDFTLSPGGMSVTFKLRRDAAFHDGAPVTADDVKWSLDRAVTVGGFPTFQMAAQMAAGSVKKPEQFVVLDDHTIRIDLTPYWRRTGRPISPALAVGSIFSDYYFFSGYHGLIALFNTMSMDKLIDAARALPKIARCTRIWSSSSSTLRWSMSRASRSIGRSWWSGCRRTSTGFTASSISARSRRAEIWHAEAWAGHGGTCISQPAPRPTSMRVGWPGQASQARARGVDRR